MRLLPVEEALRRATADLQPTEAEAVALEAAHGRVLAEDVAARLTQPPFDASAMDGYAVRAADIAALPAKLNVIGQSAAGHGFSGRVGAGQAVRIYTGAPVPRGADAIVIQENATADGEWVTVREGAPKDEFVRPRGLDFSAGDVLLQAGRRLGARDLALAAAANVAELRVRRRPRVAMLATGDELVPPGAEPAPDQIVSSIPVALAPMIEGAGALSEPLGIAGDTLASLTAHLAKAREADIVLTIGGASVGEHDLVRKALQAEGMQLDFWRIAMRPGKPLMFGRLGAQRVLGVPGNPVSAILCARMFLVPMIKRLLGLAHRDETRRAILTQDIPANGPRQHYMRATLSQGADDALSVTPARSQDSSLLTPLAQAHCLILRPPHAPAARAGDAVPVLMLDF